MDFKFRPVNIARLLSSSSHYPKNIPVRPWFKYQTLELEKVSYVLTGAQVRGKASKVLW